MGEDKNHLIIRLPNGLKLGYSEFGDTFGKPILLFHGQPGNRLFRHHNDAIAKRLGVRMISIDRPGYGLSDFQPQRTIIDWPNDVVCLCEQLGIDKFAVLGFSAGGPYAAACGVMVPERLTCIGMVSCPPPMNEITLEKAPSILRINYYLSMYFPRSLFWSFKLYWL